MGNGCFAEFCCCVPLCPCELGYSSSKDIFIIVFPGITLQEESVYSKDVVIRLYCERFAGKFDVDSSRNRIDTSPEKKDELSRLRLTSSSRKLDDRRYAIGVWRN